MTRARSRRPQQQEGSICHAPATCDESCIRKQFMTREVLQAWVATSNYPPPPKDFDSNRTQIVKDQPRAELGGEVRLTFLVNLAQSLVRHRHERLSRPHPVCTAATDGTPEWTTRHFDGKNTLTLNRVLRDRYVDIELGV